MHFQILIVLLAAMASARPVAQADSKSVDAREIQYSEVEALYAERNRKVEARELQYADIEDLYIEKDRSNPGHRDDGSQSHHVHEDAWRPHMPPQDGERFPHNHHHGGLHNDIVDNILDFFAHQARRSVPDASSRVMDRIRDFLSHETRDIHEHEQERHHRRHPHGRPDVSREILDFFASTTK